jgi:dihydroorotate dehydrogenase
LALATQEQSSYLTKIYGKNGQTALCCHLWQLVKHLKQDLRKLVFFVETFKIYLSSFKGKVALQVNFSCPNVGHDQIGLLKEVAEILNILSRLNIPLVPKFNVLLSADSMSTIMKHEACDAICISNTLPFGERPDMVDWKRFFPNGSPLAKHKYGNGGLSGKPLFPLLMEWLTEAEKLRPSKADYCRWWHPKAK